MAQIHLRIGDAQASLVQKKAAELGMTTNAFICHILKESFKKSSNKDHLEIDLKTARAIIKTMAEGFGRSLKASPEDTDKLSKILVKKFDQEVQ